MIIAGDFNAWAVDWGSRHTNHRGATILESTDRLDVIIANTGNTSTYRRNGASSIIDVTLASGAISGNIDWQVSESFTYSDFDKSFFAEVFNRSQMTSGSASDKAAHLVKELKLSCDATMRKKNDIKVEQKSGLLVERRNKRCAH